MIYYTAILAATAISPIGSPEAPRAYAAQAELNGKLVDVMVGPLQAKALDAAIAKGAGQSISLRIQRGVATLSGSYDADLNAALLDARAQRDASLQARKVQKFASHTSRTDYLKASAPVNIVAEFAGDSLRAAAPLSRKA